MKLFCGTTLSLAALISASLVIAVFLHRSSQAPIITVDQILALQGDGNQKDHFVLVDVRAEPETDVSMVPGAITKTQFERNRKFHRGKTVIAYCTVGYRSGVYAKQLRSKGWNAMNYKGSILDWCENRLPVVTKTGYRTNRVHTYDSSYKLASGYRQVFTR